MMNRIRVLSALCLLAAFACASSRGNTTDDADQQAAALLTQLTSQTEFVRFQALEAAGRRDSPFAAAQIENALIDLRPKNLSTFIFFFLEKRNPILYELMGTAKKTLENSEGSFPNIAYYYARVHPSDGLKRLFLLFETRADQKMAVCKAIGETRSAEGTAFLLEKTKTAELPGSRMPQLAGLKVSGGTIPKVHITSLLGEDLDREEIVLLSQLKTDFSDREIISLYRGNKRQREYALESIFMKPEDHFEALRFVINEMLAQGQSDRIRELLMSDRIRRSTDERVVKFRETILNRHP